MSLLKKYPVRVFARQMARELLPIEISQVGGGGKGETTCQVGTADDFLLITDDCGLAQMELP